jgi:hypothetical protein
MDSSYSPHKFSLDRLTSAFLVPVSVYINGYGT